MTNDKHDSKEDDLDQQLSLILRIFGRKQESGEPPLETLSPSQRLIPNAPLNQQEWNVVILCDCRFYRIKPAPPDDPIYQQGWSISFAPRSKQKSCPSPQEPQPGTESDDEQGEAQS